MRALAAGGRRLIGPFHDLCLGSCEKPAITTVNDYFCQSDSWVKTRPRKLGGCG
jgi:hypothetical protein